MTRQLEFEVLDWIAGSDLDPANRETLSSLRITAGAQQNIALTEVQDILAHTVRSHVYVPAYPLARWLATNWWRLRWEASGAQDSDDWRSTHCMASISGDYAWPALTISSDGEFVQLRVDADELPALSTVRYLHNVSIDVPARHFEEAVDRFLDLVDARIAVRRSQERELGELREELARERASQEESAANRLQAIAGIDPGAAPESWLTKARQLIAAWGPRSTDEVLAAVPVTQAEEAVAAIRDSNLRVELDWAKVGQSGIRQHELPWERGARLAQELRRQIGHPSGPITKQLNELLKTHLPLNRPESTRRRPLRGGYQHSGGRASVVVTSSRDDSQRFYLARLIAAHVISPNEPILAVSDKATAFQKYQRSFAQEFLCPWSDLDKFTDESGMDDEGIAEAADHFGVSEYVVQNALVNKGKAHRSLLPARMS